MVSQVEKFQALGYTGKDIRHVAVHVLPSVKIVDNAVVEHNKIYIGNYQGDFTINFPTDIIFASLCEGWVFERFELEGRQWDGVAFVPDDGDFTVSFGDQDRVSVIVSDVPKHFFTHRYHMVMRNTVTGERVATDPGTTNGDGQGSVP